MPTAAEMLLQLKFEEAERAGRMVEQQLRKFLAGALCAFCGEPLGEDREIIMDDDDRTIHKDCEEGNARYQEQMKG